MGRWIQKISLLAILSMGLPVLSPAPMAQAEAALDDEAAMGPVVQTLLDGYVKAGADGVSRVDYAALAKNRGALDSALAYFAKTDPQHFKSSQSRLAFWVNAYNVMMIDGILQDWEGNRSFSVSAHSFGIFDKARHKIAGHQVSLNEIEHVVLRGDRSRFSKKQTSKTWLGSQNRLVWDEKGMDPRFHMALNCASLGCPSLSPSAFTGANINAQFKTLTHAYLNDPKRGAGPGGLSEIFKWYGADFGGPEGVKAFVEGVYQGHEPVGYGGWIAYSWALNVTP